MGAPELDLKVAVDAGAKVAYERDVVSTANPVAWENLPPIVRHNWQRAVLPIVVAAHRDIARQAYEIAGQNVDFRNSEILSNPWQEPDDWDAAAAAL